MDLDGKVFFNSTYRLGIVIQKMNIDYKLWENLFFKVHNKMQLIYFKQNKLIQMHFLRFYSCWMLKMQSN